MLIFANPIFADNGILKNYAQPLRDAFIKYDQKSWQTYEFYVVTNLEDEESLTVEWVVNNQESFSAQKLRYFFTQGEHVIRVKVEDKYGNVINDSIKLKIEFWSLQNNLFWWIVYSLVVLIIIYYWIVKLLYLLNRRKVSKQVRYFMDILDEHGWVEKMVEEHLKNKKKEIRKKKK